MIKKFHQLNENITNEIDKLGYSSYTDVFVVQSYQGQDIDRIYLDKNDAQKVADFRNKEKYDYYRKVNKNMTDEEYDKYYSIMPKYKVYTLDDGIDSVKETVRDNYISNYL